MRLWRGRFRRPSPARATVLLACVLAMSGYGGIARATTIHVDTDEQKISETGGCSLQEAIWAANIGDSKAIVVNAGEDSFIDTECVLLADGMTGYTIVLPADATFQMSSIVDDPFNYVGPTATPIVLVEILIEANGALIEHAPNNVLFRAFAVGTRSFATGQPFLPGRGALTLRNAHIRGFAVKGGDGVYGGGGGLGAGGAIYVHGGSLTVENSTFAANSVYGGNGSRNVLNTGGGGGGGLAGNGGRAGLPPQETGNGAGGGGGGGGGARGDGGNGESSCGTPCLGIGAAGGGGGGTLEPGIDAGATNGSSGGYRCGGHGGLLALNPLDSFHDGEGGNCAGGGGGGGRDSLYAVDPSQLGGNGGNGHYGGGGGGGAGLLAAGDGARGGFGGGGGAANPSENAPPYLCSPDGGDGGFGSGGGAGPGGLGPCPIFYSGPGRGGSFAGNAGSRDGGGGAGLGGAIFNHSGSVLVMNSTFTANGAARGVAGSWPNNQPESHSGQDQGAAIFSVGGSLTVLNSTIYGNEGTNSNNGGAGIVVYAPGYDIFSPTPQVPPTSFELRNTIIAGNAAGSVVTKECRLINSDGNSVQFQGSGNLITANDNCTEGLVSSDDPLLASLALNEPGLTPTMALGEGSPAIDAADPDTALDSDQRGVSRPIGTESDIGAYEWGSVVAKCKDVTVSAGASCQAHASIDDGTFAPDGGDFELTQDPPGPYPVGMTLVTLTATHESGAFDSCQATVTVADDAAPVVTATIAKGVLSPMRQHSLVNVGLGATATDECSTAPTSFQVEVYGDEDDETPTDGTTVFSPDASDLAVGALRLRAERDDSADGRVYLVVVSGADGAGNTGHGCATVVVPHNSSPGSLTQVIGQATAAQAHCEANGGEPPVGFFVIGDGPEIGPKPKK
ncbi:MAG: choice-of-anchor Q domain-containing protein [Lysobacterales bacterium]